MAGMGSRIRTPSSVWDLIFFLYTPLSVASMG